MLFRVQRVTQSIYYCDRLRGSEIMDGNLYCYKISGEVQNSEAQLHCYRYKYEQHSCKLLSSATRRQLCFDQKNANLDKYSISNTSLITCSAAPLLVKLQSFCYFEAVLTSQSLFISAFRVRMQQCFMKSFLRWTYKMLRYAKTLQIGHQGMTAMRV